MGNFIISTVSIATFFIMLAALYIGVITLITTKGMAAFFSRSYLRFSKEARRTHISRNSEKATATTAKWKHA